MSETLKNLVEKKLGRLKRAERKFFQDVEERRPADFSMNEHEKDDPAQAGEWGNERVLKAERIVKFFTDSEAMSRVPHNGIEVRGARIDGDLDLRAIKIPFPLIFKRCAFTGDVNLKNCKIWVLDFSGSHVRSIDCTDSEVDKGIFLSNGFRSNGIVCIERATIGGPLDCTDAHFLNPKKTALDADGIKVAGDVLLNNGFSAEGMVSLVEARIKGNLECNQGLFINKGRVALNAERLNVSGDVFLCKGSWGRDEGIEEEGFRAEGEVKLVGARIRGTLECGGGMFNCSNVEEPALNATGVKVDGNVLLHNGFKAEGMVSLVGTTIKGNLECNQGLFINKGGVALNAERLNVSGDVFLCKGSWGRDEGIEEEGFRAEGEVKLVGAKICGTLECRGGIFNNSNSKEPALNATNLNIDGNVLLHRRFRAEGMVSLVGATIKGNLECNQGVFINTGEVAINAERLKVDGDVYLCEGYWGRDEGVQEEVFSADGEVKLVGAKIGGTLECRGGMFTNSDSKEPALNAKGLEVGGSVLLHNGFIAKGEVSLLSATIAGNLECKKGVFTNKGNVALDAERVKVGGDVFLCEESWGDGENLPAKGFTSEGEVRMVRAVITGDLNCIGGKFCNPKDKGVRGDNKKEHKYALRANGLNINGSIFLSEGFRAYGKVDLVDVTIGGNLECNSGWFVNREDVALDAERLKVNGDIFLCKGCWRRKNPISYRRFRAVGKVKLIGASVGGSVKCEGASFVGIEPGISSELNLYGATINRELVWTRIVSPKQARLDLRFARVVKLTDKKNSWPGPDNLFLDGLVYDEISFDTVQNTQDAGRRFDWRWLWGFLVKLWKRLFVPYCGDIEKGARIEWLRLQNEFYHQPYEQLVSVLRKNGRDNDARTVLIAKAEDPARLMSMPFFGKCWHSFLGATIGYGYRPWRALWISAVVVALGTAIFWIGHNEEIIKETKVVEHVSVAGREPNVTPDYPEFNALVYSLDMFVPLVDLRQATYWLPGADPNAGPSADPNDKPGAKQDEGNDDSKEVTISVGLLRLYTWFHIILGWILTTLLVAGLSGLVKR